MVQNVTLFAARSLACRFYKAAMHRDHWRLSLFVVVFLKALHLAAQPPLQVQWTSELPNVSTVLAAFIDQNNGLVEVAYSEDSGSACNNEEYWHRYDANGRLDFGFGSSWMGCIEAMGTSLDHFAVAASRQGFDVIYIVNASTLNNQYFISSMFGSITGPANSNYVAAHSILADGGDVYIGGVSSHCSTGWPVFKLGGGPEWPACVPAAPQSMEATADSILSIYFPAVHMMDKISGTVGGTFNLFSGSTNHAGKTCMNGDTLYWVCSVDGSLRAGKYLLGYGNIWEQVLPFSQWPVELKYDEHGRLWTAAGNDLIWIDMGTGAFSSETIGEQINALDLHAGKMVIAGRMNTNLNFIFYGTIQP